MPYKDPEKRKAANRQSMAKARAAAKTENRRKRECCRCRCEGEGVDVYRLPGECAGELAGGVRRLSCAVGVQPAPRSRRKRHRRAEEAALAHSPVMFLAIWHRSRRKRVDGENLATIGKSTLSAKNAPTSSESFTGA